MTADGTRMIGHVILQKSYDGEDLLKVSGDKLLASGSRGAVVDAVKCGSIADQEGHILAGEYHASLKCGPTLHVHTLSHPPQLHITAVLNLVIVSSCQIYRDFCLSLIIR